MSDQSPGPRARPSRAGWQSAAWVVLALWLTAPSWAVQSVWVRIDHAIDEPVLASHLDHLQLKDYGAFQWGRIPASMAAELTDLNVSFVQFDNPFLLSLGGEVFDPLDDPVPAATSSSGEFHLVQFHGPVRPDWLDDLRTQGFELAQPLHPFSYIVWSDQALAATGSASSSVRWSGPMRPEWKLQPRLRRFGPEHLDTMLLVSAHADPDQVRGELEQLGTVHSVRPVTTHFKVVHMALAGDRYQPLARLGFVYTVQHIPPETGPRGEMSNQSVVGQINADGMVMPGYDQWLDQSGFDGDGITVGIVDRGILTGHVDLVDRMRPCRGDNDSCTESLPTSHATHIAGAVAGTATSGIRLDGFLRGQGVAPGAGLVNQTYLPFTNPGHPSGLVPDGMLMIFEDSVRSGALLTNNSWGPANSAQGYDIPTQQVDMISRDADRDRRGNQSLLAVWAIMNGFGDGANECAPSSLGSPDEAKNLLAVSSTWLQTMAGAQMPNLFSISANAAHGKACDGRLVPHIVAPGCNTDSATAASDNSHATFCGTSFAAPVVAGAIAVWAEMFQALTGQAPSPALVKAVFTATATNLAGNTNADGQVMGHRPDRYQGFGRLDLDRVMRHRPGETLFVHDQEKVFTAAGQDWRARLQAVDVDQPVRLMLAWTDAPGHALGGPTPAWVNDLDLAVRSGDQIYLGNVFGAEGWSAPGGQPDPRNNLEAVFLQPDQHQGELSVKVLAADIAGDALAPYQPSQPRQDFALACFNCQPAPDPEPEPEDKLFRDRFEHLPVDPPAAAPRAANAAPEME